MVKKRGLIFLVLLFVIPLALADSDQIQFIKIPDLNLSTGSNNDVINLGDYFNGTDLKYKHKAGSKGLEGVIIYIDSKSRTDITADFPGDYSVIFIADNDTDDRESNDVKLTVTGGIIKVAVLDFFPPAGNIKMKKGEKKTFAVSGGNVTAEWYLDNLKLPETSGTFEYDASIEGVKELKVLVTGQTNTWNITVEAEVIVEEVLAELVSVCGNNVKEKGENCDNCIEDVKCAKGTVCKNGICMKDESISGLILWFALLGIMLIALVIGVIFAKKKGYLSNLNFGFLSNFNFLTNIFNKFRKKEIETIEEIKEEIIEEKPEKDISNLKIYILDNLKRGYKKRELVDSALQQGWSKEQIDESLKIEERLRSLENYVVENLKKGYKKEDLINACLKQGWSKEDIDEVLLKI